MQSNDFALVFSSDTTKPLGEVQVESTPVAADDNETASEIVDEKQDAPPQEPSVENVDDEILPEGAIAVVGDTVTPPQATVGDAGQARINELGTSSEPQLEALDEVVNAPATVVPPVVSEKQVSDREKVSVDVNSGDERQKVKSIPSDAQTSPRNDNIAELGFVGRVGGNLPDGPPKYSPTPLAWTASGEPVRSAHVDGRKTERVAIPITAAATPPTVELVPSDKPVEDAIPMFAQKESEKIAVSGDLAKASIPQGMLTEPLQNQSAIAGPRNVVQPQAAMAVGHQMAVAVSKSPDGIIELALNPEELGRVAMSLKTVDGVLNLVVSTERPETQDLMRRHLDALAQEFRGLGFKDVAFSFSDGERGQHSRNATLLGVESTTETEVASQQGRTTGIVKTSGLDLRL